MSALTTTIAVRGWWPRRAVHGLAIEVDRPFDSEYGFAMGYEIAGAWGAKMARGEGDVIAWVGDGSYLMMNSDIYSTVTTGHKVIFIVCDNAGYAVINRLQVHSGGAEFNNQLQTTRRVRDVAVDF
jgi:3D-(3,5/4)-trihydroxycyclohexane-1,2-dione acylhydrolase (decyclizing)